MMELQNGNVRIIADHVMEHKKMRNNVVIHVNRSKWRITKRDGALGILGTLNNVKERELMGAKRRKHWIAGKDAMSRDLCRLNGVRGISILRPDMGLAINMDHNTILEHFKGGVLILPIPFTI